LQLWQRIEDEAKRAGAKRILVEHATPALKETYEKHGFRKRALRRFIGSTVMEKRLP
jgi:ribosomal protein S18 acetylase RimI-like enzyme